MELGTSAIQTSLSKVFWLALRSQIIAAVACWIERRLVVA